MTTVLALNAGSSSIKFAAYESVMPAGTPTGELRLLFKGHVASAGTNIELLARDKDGSIIERLIWQPTGGSLNHDEALARMFDWLSEQRSGRAFTAVGHRVVHGGQAFSAPVCIAGHVLDDLDAMIPMAPLHQAHSLKAIRVVGERWPDRVQVACFDTAFHDTLPEVARAFALPRDITELGVRRYGFHGLSFEYITNELPRVLGNVASAKIIVAHLGNGASLCAMMDGKSVGTTMGFSVLDGLVMGSRCGSLDAGVVLYLQQQLHMSVQEVSELLYHRSGLLGMSGISGDMRVLLASTDPRAAAAIDLFVYRIVVEIGALAAAMGGVDALVFTAGIGERAAPIRSRICAGCSWLGAVLDDTANDIDLELIHAGSSRLRLAVVPTDEEYMIAVHTLQCVQGESQR